MTETDSILELVDMLHSMLSEAWGVPLGNDKCVVDRVKALELVEEIKAQLPAEVAEARRLVAAREETVAAAKREAESIRHMAEENARKQLEEQEIVRAANAKAAEIIAQAESKSRELRRVANDYVDDALRRTEEAVTSALDGVRQSRARFRNAAVSYGAAVRPEEPVTNADGAEE